MKRGKSRNEIALILASLQKKKKMEDPDEIRERELEIQQRKRDKTIHVGHSRGANAAGKVVLESNGGLSSSGGASTFC